VRQGTGPFTEYFTTTNTYEWLAVARNTTYEAKVLAYDKASNRSLFSAVASRATERDTVPPAAPTGLTGQPGFNFIGMTWTNPADADLAHVEIWGGSTANSANATRLASVSASPSTQSSYIHSGLANGSTHYFWAKAVDTSDNVSPFSASSGAIKTVLIDITDVAPAVNTGITRTVDVLPNPTGWTGGPLVFLKTDGKLYRLVSGRWTAEVSPVDLSELITAPFIDSKGLDVRDAQGNIMFGSDGLISPGATIPVNGTPVSISTIASNALTPSLHFVGEFANPPTQAQLGDQWRQNAVYKNSMDGRSYVLTGDPLDWLIYLEDGQSFYVTIESSNGTVFRVGQSKSTTLKARLFKNGAEVTEQVPDHWFGWRRVSGIPRSAPDDDATFNTRYRQGYKNIEVTIDDIYARATFFVDINN
jgi:hypothetical protein